jgi:hypothetical protein
MAAGGHDALELLAALILVIGGAILVAQSLRMRAVGSHPVAAPADPAGAGSGVTPTVGRSIALILAGLSGGAAIIHLAAAPGHYAEIGDLATGFVVAAAFQGLWVRWCLAGPSQRTIVVGIAGNLAIVAAWAWTRTVGLPIGDLAGMPEPVGFPDGASVAFELALVAGLAGRWLGLHGRAAPSLPAARMLASIAVVPALGLVLVLTSLATVAIASGLDHGSPAEVSPMTMADPAAMQ